MKNSLASMSWGKSRGQEPSPMLKGERNLEELWQCFIEIGL